MIVLSCLHVHIKIGNVYENTLKEISEYGLVSKDPENIAHKGSLARLGFVKNWCQKKNINI